VWAVIGLAGIGDLKVLLLVIAILLFNFDGTKSVCTVGHESQSKHTVGKNGVGNTMKRRIGSQKRQKLEII
jgi:hypothetical protein